MKIFDIITEGPKWDAVKKSAKDFWHGTDEEHAQEKHEKEAYAKRKKNKKRAKKGKVKEETQDISFGQLDPNQEGIVLLGAGGDLKDWVNGVTKVLNDEGIAKGGPEELWAQELKLTTSGGRTDLALVFKPGAKLDMGKMAMWRLKFGDCSWISDYVDNYARQHEGGEDIEETATAGGTASGSVATVSTNITPNCGVPAPKSRPGKKTKKVNKPALLSRSM